MTSIHQIFAGPGRKGFTAARSRNEIYRTDAICVRESFSFSYLGSQLTSQTP